MVIECAARDEKPGSLRFGITYPMNASISLHPLERSDFPLLQEWLSAPHSVTARARDAQVETTACDIFGREENL
jgi:hypothetical protein